VNQSIAFHTLGCKQNQFDSQSLRVRLLELGFREARKLESARWIIVNTCAVTNRAIAKARGEISRLRRLNPDAEIIAVGCGVRYQPEHFSAADYVDTFPPALRLKGDDGEKNEIGADLPSPHGLIPAGRSRAMLRIQNGCDQFCSYCIVPHLRGRSRSVPAEDCIAALRELLAGGIAEIVLTGTNIALWGRDLPGSPTLIDLLKSLVVEAGDSRIRLSTLEPQLISPDFIAWCVSQPQICRHFHLAVQSGSPRILTRMQRGEGPSDLYGFLRDLKCSRPEISIGADVIAGFPGETQADFGLTLNLIESIPFDYLHVFPFSERPGTKAANLGDRVPVSERLKRAKVLRERDKLQRESFIEINADKSQDVVILERNRFGHREGLTSNYRHVTFNDDFQPPGYRFTVPIEKCGSFAYK